MLRAAALDRKAVIRITAVLLLCLIVSLCLITEAGIIPHECHVENGTCLLCAATDFARKSVKSLTVAVMSAAFIVGALICTAFLMTDTGRTGKVNTPVALKTKLSD